MSEKNEGSIRERNVWGDALLEAGWLVAVLLAGLFLNPFSRRVFEIPKNFLFCGLTIFLLTIFVLRFGQKRPSLRIQQAGRRLLQEPVTLGVGVYLLLQGMTTFLSVAPQLSWWGSDMRGHGLLTRLSYVAFYGVLVRAVRRQDQRQRLLTCLLLGSFPVALYAMAQHHGVTLLHYSGPYIRVTERVISTLGNPLFVAAYLAMIVPLTLWRLGLTVQEGYQSRSLLMAMESGLYALLLLLQSMAILYAQSRGPLLGLGVGLFFMVFVSAWRTHQRLAWVALAGAAIGGALVIALNIPTIPLGALRIVPILGRLGGIAQEGGTLYERRQGWEVILYAVLQSPWRSMLGHGPETLSVLFDQYAAAKGVALSFDRAHNVFLDALFEAGFVGAGGYLLFWAAIFYQGMVEVGLLVTRREKGSFIGCMACGAGLGLLIPWMRPGMLAWATLGVPAGLLAGALLYLIGAWGRGRSPGVGAAGLASGWRLALWAGLVVHYVESFTGLGDFSSRFLFWLFLALLIGGGCMRLPTSAISMTPVTGFQANQQGQAGWFSDGWQRINPDRRVFIAMSLILAVIPGCWIFAFVHGFGVPNALPAAIGMLAGMWAWIGLVLVCDHRRWVSRPLSWIHGWGLYALVSGLWVMPYGLYHYGRMQRVLFFDEGVRVWVSWVFVTLVVAAGIWALPSFPRRQVRWAVLPRLGASAVLMSLCFLGIWQLAVRPTRAEVFIKVGQLAVQAGQWSVGLQSLQQAVAWRPDHPGYHELLGKAYERYAEKMADEALRDAGFAAASRAYAAGMTRTPDDYPFWVLLGRLYQKWAVYTRDPALQLERMRAATRHEAAALERRPWSAKSWFELAERYRKVGLFAEALWAYQQVIELTDPAYWAVAYAGMGAIYQERGAYGAAIQAYRRASEIAPTWTEPYQRLVLLYDALGQRDEALAEWQKIRDLMPGGAPETVEAWLLRQR